MQNALVSKFISKHVRAQAHPEFRPGDTIRVHVRIREGDKERLQAFEGTVIARKNVGLSETITVRKVSFSTCVERSGGVQAPLSDPIDLVPCTPLRGAKL